ncbi:MAG: Na+/H+ antiporter subunit E [Sulfuritalea sp.]|nr:Na+/H+ antiporter subunit E [Sulfuritalea sp.]
MRVAPVLRRTLAFALLWWVLVEGSSVSWGIGLASVGLATFASLRLWPPAHWRISYAGVAAFAGWFLLESAKGAVQVAALAFQRRPDLAPRIIEISLALPAGAATVLIVNVLNLLPGTMCTDVEGKILRVHVLDGRLPVVEEVRAAEARIARMLGVTQ